MSYLMDPTMVVCDLKQVAINAVTAVLDCQVNLQGWLYSLTQIAQQKVQELGLTPVYQDGLGTKCPALGGGVKSGEKKSVENVCTSWSERLITKVMRYVSLCTWVQRSINKISNENAPKDMLTLMTALLYYPFISSNL
jgi:hypothetical protein